MKRHLRKYLGSKRALCLLAVILFTAIYLYAQSAMALRVTVKRIVFEGADRSDIITIINNTAEEQIYRLGWRPMTMTEDQALVYLQDTDPATIEGLRPADDMIRFAPRRVVLPPGSSQKVRFMLRRPKDLEAGEYRSHFWIQPEAEAAKFSGQAPADGKPRVELKMLTGLTLPIIVRAGDLTATAAIRDLSAQINAGEVNVSFAVHREGERSLYGDMKFFCDGTLIREARGVAVYTEVTRRNMSFNFPLAADGPQSCRTVSVQYVATEDDKQFRGDVMAEAQTTL